jgi:hypothetical protein
MTCCRGDDDVVIGGPGIDIIDGGDGDDIETQDSVPSGEPPA